LSQQLPRPESDPADQQGGQDEDDDTVAFLMYLREEAIAEGVDFYGAIIGGDGPPRLISYMAPDHLDDLADDPDSQRQP
jgi:hypothetical protein